MSKDNYQYVEDMSNRFIEDLKNIYSNETKETVESSSKSNRKCQRCLKQYVQFICESCQPLNLFCKSCDDFVHSLVSKRDHIRFSYEDTFPNSQNNLLRYQENFKERTENIETKDSIKHYNNQNISLRYQENLKEQSKQHKVNLKTLEDIDHSQLIQKKTLIYSTNKFTVFLRKNKFLQLKDL